MSLVISLGRNERYHVTEERKGLLRMNKSGLDRNGYSVGQEYCVHNHSKDKNLPGDVSEVLQACRVLAYPNIHNFLVRGAYRLVWY